MGTDVCAGRHQPIIKKHAIEKNERLINNISLYKFRLYRYCDAG
jgi:hypothetical protein